MTARQLCRPAVANLDLAVSGRRSVADHEMISKSVWHPTNVPMVIIEDPGVALARTAVVHHNILPSVSCHPGFIDRLADSRG